jgi:hypothetical protein
MGTEREPPVGGGSEPPGGGEPPLSGPERVRRARRETRRRQLLRRRITAVVVVLLVILLVPPAISFGAYMSRPSSVPWTVRSVEWVRDNHGAWLVDFTERTYYSLTAPKKGGPGLSALPSVAADPTGTTPKPARTTQPAYTPAAITPVIRPALSGEGVWHAVGRRIGGVYPIRATVFRSERDYPRIVTYAAWIDHSLTQFALYPGRTEPPQGSPRGPMMVPDGQRGRLLAVFNSAFKYKDGHGGFAVNGRVYSPFTAGLSTLVGYNDGRVDIVKWPGGNPPANVAFARQNLPMIVDNGKANPDLNTNGAQWGWTLGNSIRVWRSGVGVDGHGNLIYVAAPSQTVMSLASALIRAGAVRALEFDINVYWPTFNYYRRPDAQSPVKFLPNSQHPGLTRYLTPDDRDFLAVYARSANSDFTVPFK